MKNRLISAVFLLAFLLAIISANAAEESTSSDQNNAELISMIINDLHCKSDLTIDHIDAITTITGLGASLTQYKEKLQSNLGILDSYFDSSD